MKINNLYLNGVYSFIGQSERLLYIGRNWSGNGYWHQFEKESEPGIVWSELQDSDLKLLELIERPLTK